MFVRLFSFLSLLSLPSPPLLLGHASHHSLSLPTSASLFPLLIPPSFALLPLCAGSAPSFSPPPQPPVTHSGAAGPDPAPAPGSAPAPYPIHSPSIPAPLPRSPRSVPAPLPRSPAGDSSAPPAGRRGKGGPAQTPHPAGRAAGTRADPRTSGDAALRRGVRMTERHPCSPSPSPLPSSCARQRSPAPGASWRTLARIPYRFLLVFLGGNKVTPALKLRATTCRAGQQREKLVKARVILSRHLLGCPFPCPWQGWRGAVAAGVPRGCAQPISRLPSLCATAPPQSETAGARHRSQGCSLGEHCPECALCPLCTLQQEPSDKGSGMKNFHIMPVQKGAYWWTGK